MKSSTGGRVKSILHDTVTNIAQVALEQRAPREIQFNSDPNNLKPGEQSLNQLYFEQAQNEVKKGLSGSAKVVQSFPRFARTIDITRFLVFYECFKKIVDIHGSICEIGVLHGNCTFSMAHFSEIFEPRNYLREIIGFDTFEGNPMNFSDKDKINSQENENFARFNANTVSSFSDVQASADLFESGKHLTQFKKIRLIKGDACETIPSFVNSNTGLIVSMIILAVDMYDPSVAAFRNLYPLMPKGGLVLLGASGFNQNPGETQALFDEVGISNIELKRFDFATKWSYFIKK